MASEASGGSNGFLYFIVGALLIAVIGLGVAFYTGAIGQSPTDRAIERSADAVGEAADSVSDSVEKAAN